VKLKANEVFKDKNNTGLIKTGPTGPIVNLVYTEDGTLKNKTMRVRGEKKLSAHLWASTLRIIVIALPTPLMTNYVL